MNFERRQESSAALSPESFLGSAASLRWCVAVAVAFSFIAASLRRNLEVMQHSIADNLSKAGWSSGYVSAIDFHGRTIWIADAHRDDGERLLCAPRKT